MNKIKPSPVGKGRKRRALPEEWARNKDKYKRHQPKQLPNYPACEHKGKKTFRCKTLKMQDIKAFHDNMYKTYNKTVQDCFILKNIEVKLPQRIQKTESVRPKKKSITVEYFVKIKNTKTFKVQVCQKSFLGILNISKDRVQRIARNYFESGELPKERRGGDRMSVKYVNKRDNVRNFVQSLKNCSETHYCRGKSIIRQYLPGNLSISKLLKMYNFDQPDNMQVKRSFFRKIINLEYNLGFGIPVTDACSSCMSYKQQIKVETDKSKCAQMIMEYRVHKLRAKAFFSKLKEKRDGLVTVSFDCQKNMVLPKVPDQVAYYSRQLYTYNFTIFEGSSENKMTLHNTFIYTWNENDFPKGSNEISSAVFNRLCQIDLNDCSTLRLCADGCGGQNRNSMMICMCSYFLLNIAPQNVNQLEIIYPVPGHSFLPADRVFGRIEKEVKKIPVISNPDQYIDIFKRHGTVSKMETDLTVFDWKELTELYLKPTKNWHFRFSQAKRFVLKRGQNNNTVTVTGEWSYNSNTGADKSVIRKGKKLKEAVLTEINRGCPVKEAKLKDVKKLLEKHYGVSNWMNLPENDFLKNVLQTKNIMPDDTPEEHYCEERAEEETELLV